MMRRRSARWRGDKSSWMASCAVCHARNAARCAARARANALFSSPTSCSLFARWLTVVVWAGGSGGAPRRQAFRPARPCEGLIPHRPCTCDRCHRLCRPSSRSVENAPRPAWSHLWGRRRAQALCRRRDSLHRLKTPIQWHFLCGTGKHAVRCFVDEPG